MKRSLIASLVVAAMAAAAAEGPVSLEFDVARMEDSSGEGPERDRPYIMLGTQRVAFSQPFKSTLVSGADKLTIHFADRGLSGVITVSNSRFTPALEFQNAMDEYHKAAGEGIPAEAEEVNLKGGNSTAYAVNEWKCQVFEWTYLLYGRQFYRQVAYINITPECQVNLTLVSTLEESQKLLPIAKRFMSSWYFASSIPKDYIK